MGSKHVCFQIFLLVLTLICSSWRMMRCSSWAEVMVFPKTTFYAKLSEITYWFQCWFEMKIQRKVLEDLILRLKFRDMKLHLKFYPWLCCSHLFCIALSIISWYIEYYCYSWGLHLMLTERRYLLRWKYISYLWEEQNHKHGCVFLECPRAVTFLTHLKHPGLPEQSRTSLTRKSRKQIRKKLLTLDMSAFYFGIVFLLWPVFREGKLGTCTNLIFHLLSFSHKCSQFQYQMEISNMAYRFLQLSTFLIQMNISVANQG